MWSRNYNIGLLWNLLKIIPFRETASEPEYTDCVGTYLPMACREIGILMLPVSCRRGITTKMERSTNWKILPLTRKSMGGQETLR